MSPLGFVSSTPERFVKLFLSDLDKDIKPYRLSNKEIKKTKAKRFYNKNNKAYWVDSNKYLYFANKQALPSKKDQVEWDAFHDNEDAILVEYTEPLKYRTRVEWFLNLESFKSRFKEVLDETPSSYATPTYTIEKRGYKKLHPQDRQNIFRLPFFNIETEYSLSNTLNTKQIYTQMARKWAKMLDGYKFFGEWFENVEMLEDIIEKYLGYLENIEQK